MHRQIADTAMAQSTRKSRHPIGSPRELPAAGHDADTGVENSAHAPLHQISAVAADTRNLPISHTKSTTIASDNWKAVAAGKPRYRSSEPSTQLQELTIISSLC